MLTLRVHSVSSEDVQDQEVGVSVLFQSVLQVPENVIACPEIVVMHYVAVLGVGGTVMLHGFFERFNVICAGRQVSHELLSAAFLNITVLNRLNSIKDCSAEVDYQDLVVDEEILL